MKGCEVNMEKVDQILAFIFEENVDAFKEQKARQRLTQAINEMKKEDEAYNVNYSVFIKDTKKLKWQDNKAHFFKVFYAEIEYAMEKYELRQSDVDFLLRLGKFLKWEINLIVDEEDTPLNQKELAEKLKMSVRNLQRLLNPLLLRYVIYDVKFGRENFYMVNPYFIFIGKSINAEIPKLFNMLGYDNLVESRSNRREKVNKRNDINDLGE